MLQNSTLDEGSYRAACLARHSQVSCDGETNLTLSILQGPKRSIARGDFGAYCNSQVVVLDSGPIGAQHLQKAINSTSEMTSFSNHSAIGGIQSSKYSNIDSKIAKRKQTKALNKKTKSKVTSDGHEPMFCKIDLVNRGKKEPRVRNGEPKPRPPKGELDKKTLSSSYS